MEYVEMLMYKQFWRTHQQNITAATIVPVVSGCMMAYASVAPWLKDPLGKVYSGWNISINIGWQIQFSACTYGLLCLCSAIYAFLVAGANLPERIYLPGGAGILLRRYCKNRSQLVTFLCITPCILFFLQYLMLDITDINALAEHKVQMLLINQHLGYNLSAPHILISPFALDITTLSGRVDLLIDQLSFGPLLPCLSAGILLTYLHYNVRQRNVHRKTDHPHTRIWKVTLIGCICLCAILLGRAPAAQVCADQAQEFLTIGDYTQASLWLDREAVLSPAIDQLSSYHIQRGQITYFQKNDEQSDDSHAYLAFAASQQRRYKDAYQELFGVWVQHRSTNWIIEEINKILMQFAESKQPLAKPTDESLKVIAKRYDAALPQIQELVEIDPTNIYAQYMLGRINYELHNYIDCTVNMQQVYRLSTNRDIQSSAYTYIGLSESGQGSYSVARLFLLKAVALDPNYYNNVAREELSGLH